MPRHRLDVLSVPVRLVRLKKKDLPPVCEGSAPCPPVLPYASPPSGCPLCSGKISKI
jgi:hypothetical protein